METFLICHQYLIINWWLMFLQAYKNNYTHSCEKHAEHALAAIVSHKSHQIIKEPIWAWEDKKYFATPAAALYTQTG